MKDNSFWPSFSDLMTSLFFVMMVLYILTFVKLKQDQEQYRIAAEKYEKLQEIEKSLQTLEGDYFEFDENNKRFRLNIDTKFKSNSHQISDFDVKIKEDVIDAGHSIYYLLDSLNKSNQFTVQYLIVIEGNAQRTVTNWISDPNNGYRLSYKRALSIYNYWKENGINFNNLKNVEVLLAGSGHFGKSRVSAKKLDEYDSELNRRFTIQITGKIGEFK